MTKGLFHVLNVRGALQVELTWKDTLNLFMKALDPTNALTVIAALQEKVIVEDTLI